MSLDQKWVDIKVIDGVIVSIHPADSSLQWDPNECQVYQVREGDNIFVGNPFKFEDLI